MDADHSNPSTAGNGGFCAKREYSRGRSRPSPKSLTLRDTRQCGSNLGPFRASSRVQKRASGKRARSVPRSRLCSGQLPACPSSGRNRINPAQSPAHSGRFASQTWSNALKNGMARRANKHPGRAMSACGCRQLGNMQSRDLVLSPAG